MKTKTKTLISKEIKRLAYKKGYPHIKLSFNAYMSVLIEASQRLQMSHNETIQHVDHVSRVVR